MGDAGATPDSGYYLPALVEGIFYPDSGDIIYGGEDGQYRDVNGDGITDLLVGRFSARNEEELEILVKKTMNNEPINRSFVNWDKLLTVLGTHVTNTDIRYNSVYTGNFQRSISNFLDKCAFTDEMIKSIIVTEFPDTGIWYRSVCYDTLTDSSFYTIEDYEHFCPEYLGMIDFEEMEVSFQDTILTGIYNSTWRWDSIVGDTTGGFNDTLIYHRDAIEVRDSILTALNEGNFWVLYGNHGDVEEWIGPQLKNSDVDSIGSGDLSVFMTETCHSGDIYGNSISKMWLNSYDDRGAIGYIGNARIGSALDFTFCFEEGMYPITLGEFLSVGVLKLNLQGDPAYTAGLAPDSMNLPELYIHTRVTDDYIIGNAIDTLCLVEIGNLGFNSACTTSYHILVYDEDDSLVMGFTGYTDSLPPDSSISFAITTGDTLQPGMYDIIAVVDSLDEVNELIEYNNHHYMRNLIVHSNFELIVHEGWNFVSLPMMTSTTLSEIFSGRDTINNEIYIYNGIAETYIDVADDMNIPGKAYFVKYPSVDTVQLMGVPIDTFSISIFNEFFFSGSDSLYRKRNRIVSTLGSTIEKQPVCKLRTDYNHSDFQVFEVSPLMPYIVLADTIEPGKGYIFCGWTDSRLNHLTLTLPDSCGDESYYSYYSLFSGVPTIPEEEDSLYFETLITDSTITITNESNDSLGGVEIFLYTNSSIISGITDSSGQFTNSSIAERESLFIVIEKNSYIPKLIMPNSILPGSHILYGKDIQFDSDLRINAGDTLSIAKGTNIFIEPDADGAGGGIDSTFIEILVKGVLIAEGDSSDPVVFVPDTTDTSGSHWSGIVVQDSGSVVMDYAELEYCDYGVYNNAGGPISMSNVTLKGGSEIKADFTQSSASKTIQLDNITTDGYITIINHDGDSWVKNSSFDGTQTPITITGSSDTLDIFNCEFESFSSYGITASNSAKLKIENCSFKNGDSKSTTIFLNNSTARMYNSIIDSCGIGVYVGNGSDFWAGDTTSLDGEAGNVIQNCSSFIVYL